MAKAHSKAAKRRRLFRFSLGALLLLTIPVGIASLWLRGLYMGPTPIHWKPFSPKSLSDHLTKGQPVLVYFRADWSPNAALQRKRVLETDAMRHAILLNNVVALDADYTSSSPLIQAALKSINVASVPAVAIYNPSSPESPVVLTGLVSEEAIRDALHTATVRAAQNR